MIILCTEEMQSKSCLAAFFDLNEKLIYAETAEERGIEGIIAGAGAAAHLGGVLAAVTPLPVIGVPINATALQGLDALYAMVQMPSGIPVATVAINGAKNAGILAAQILSVKEPELRKQLKAYKEKMAQEDTDAFEEYLESDYSNDFLNLK